MNASSDSSWSVSSVESTGRGRPGVSPESRYQHAIKILREGKLGPADLLTYVLNNDNHENHRFRSGIYKKGGKMGQILDMVIGSYEGKECLSEWIRDRGIDIVGKIISDEMDIVKKSFTMNTADITPDFIDKWTLESTVGTVAKRDAPILTRLLLRAAQTESALAKNKSKKPDIVSSILSHLKKH
jgi:hypothetical protein